MFRLGGRVQVATITGSSWCDERGSTDGPRAEFDRRGLACDLAVAVHGCWAIRRAFSDMLQSSGARAERLAGPSAVGAGRP